MVRTKKQPSKTPPKSSSKKKTVSHSKKKWSTTIASQKEKDKLVWELKQSMQHLGKLPSMVMAPIIAFVSSQYEKIPKERRKKLGDISKNMKKWSHEGLESMKEWFQDLKSGKPVKTKSQKGKKKKTIKKKDETKKIKEPLKKELSKKTKQRVSTSNKTQTQVKQKKQSLDRFTKIEWITIKIQRILREWGVDSYEKLSTTSVVDIRKILAEKNVSFEKGQPLQWKKRAKILCKT